MYSQEGATKTTEDFLMMLASIKDVVDSPSDADKQYKKGFNDCYCLVVELIAQIEQHMAKVISKESEKVAKKTFRR